MSAWIRTFEEEEAKGDLKRVYEVLRNKRGNISDVMKAQSLDPESIRLHLDLYLHLMFGSSTLTRLDREMIAVVVSSLNKCSYCVTHHSEALLAHTRDRTLLGNLANLEFPELPPKQRAMLEYASKLTREPAKMQREDVEKVKTAGFSDEEILRISLITSYFNFANRIVSGLGVSLEDKGTRVYKY